MIRYFAAMLSLLILLPFAVAQTAPPKPRDPVATPAEQIKILKDFRVERLYSVPKDKEGSWVALCVDPKGRLIVSDQGGGLYRITPPALGGKPADTESRKDPRQHRSGPGAALGVRQSLRRGQWQ